MVRLIARALVSAGVAACLAVPSFAGEMMRDSTQYSGTSRHSMEHAGMSSHGAWWRGYILTPMDQKRFRAMGLTNKEIYIVANTAHLTGRDPDDIVQMIFRGQTASMIAYEYMLSPDLLTTPQPEWTTPEWEQAVEHGSSWPMYISGDRGMGNGERGMRR
jgi:hypothetical protein